MNESKKYIDLVIGVLENWWVKFAEFTPNLIVGILVFLFFLYTSKFLSKISVDLFQKLFPKSRNQDTVITLIGFFRFLIILIGTFITLEIMGLSGFFIKFLGSLGVAGIIAGVALKDIVSSMFSGMLVSVDKAFKVGDYVTINNISGTVEEIGFLTTKVINDEGKKVFIPNQMIFSAPFINITASEHRKIIIDLEIPNTENLEKANSVLLNEVQSLGFVQDPESAEVVFVRQKLGIYSLQVRFWMKPGENIQSVRSEAIVKLKNRLDAEGIATSVPATVSSL
ncbi:mechanosensitive ion channel family protein [Chryseobacterium taklimakanense]|uniref:mechanosensitive ion channel family protein n=1 Tax=Chryseobacterium taklimakanense TaxID=536441 RepID=UPI001EF5C798|nr:mechanosensitive ion channel family protein [Chryseobacterium taklimakanense]MCG7280013.1 mechanosensitive ion channel family protein [Chryseobacterium taklimakanense]